MDAQPSRHFPVLENEASCLEDVKEAIAGTQEFKVAEVEDEDHRLLFFNYRWLVRFTRGSHTHAPCTQVHQGNVSRTQGRPLGARAKALFAETRMQRIGVQSGRARSDFGGREEIS